RAVAGAGLRGGETVEHVLIAWVDVRRLLEVPDGTLEVAAVVEEHTVVQQVLEALGVLRPLLPGPLAEQAEGAGTLQEITLLGMALDQLVQELGRAVEVLFPQCLDGLFVHLEGVTGASVVNRRPLLVRHACLPPPSTREVQPE